MNSSKKNKISWLFAGLFGLIAIAYLGIIISSDMSLAEVGRYAPALFYLILAFSGIRKGVGLLEESYERIKQNPDVLEINFYASLLFFGSIIALILISVALVLSGRGFLMLMTVPPAFFLLLMAGGLMSRITKGATAIYFAEGRGPLSSVLRSLTLTHRYIAISFYRHLIMASDDLLGRLIGRRILSFIGFPGQILDEGANLALSYATIIAAVERQSGAKSVLESARLTLDEPSKTTFMSLGLTAILIGLGVFLLIPMAVSFGMLVLLYDSVELSLLLIVSSIPFITGVVLYLFLGSVASSAQEIALLEIYSQSRRPT